MDMENKNDIIDSVVPYFFSTETGKKVLSEIKKCNFFQLQNRLFFVIDDITNTIKIYWTEDMSKTKIDYILKNSNLSLVFDIEETNDFNSSFIICSLSFHGSRIIVNIKRCIGMISADGSFLEKSLDYQIEERTFLINKISYKYYHEFLKHREEIRKDLIIRGGKKEEILKRVRKE